MKLLTLAGLALASLSLCACAGGPLPLTGNPAADAKAAVANVQSVNGNLQIINQQLLGEIVKKCGFDVDFNVAIPNPVPTGNLKISCHIAPGDLPTATITPAGGSFGGGGSTAVTLPAGTVAVPVAPQ